ncbi:hypothetical protein IGI04_011773 [Brassica rapa subsp. trilocularis]|uniref:Uncharacterized protein n=1 Tax=Brassica rapa subsp. trilocularis TaxID=1813537 RepID=A0ABQ7N422_BRACM|nr:hypothetical protein IGI04_011773 [Brassica rapa subsp. trilocularis]
MKTERAQMILLKEISQHSSKEFGCPSSRLPLRKAPTTGPLSFTARQSLSGSHLLLPEEEIKGSSKQVHVWDVSKQHGPANDSRKRSLDHGNGDVSGASKCET